MLVFYCYFLAEGYGSAVMFMMLQSVPAYKEQLVYYYGVSILLNIINLAGRAVLYFLYEGVPLFNNYKKTSLIISLHNHRSSFYWPKNHHRANNRTHNTTFLLSD